MHRLVVNPGTPQAWEIILKPGFNSIGRGQDNDFTISHDSVSTLHCQIIVEGEIIKIEDLKFCKICGNECVPVKFKAAVEQVNFFAAVPQAFKYPFIGDGLMLLFGGTFFFGFLDLANYISRHALKYGLRAMMMRVAIFTFIFGIGYLFAYLKKIIAATSDGDPHMPDWPEFSEWQADIVTPMFQFVVVSFLSFGPALVFQIWGAWADWDYAWLFVVPLALLGCIYFPMAFLGVAIFDTLAAALKPAFVVGSILRIPREYSVAAAEFIGIIGIRWLSEYLLGVVMKIPLAPALLADLITIYLLMVEARILGLLFLSKRRTLGWFKKDRPAGENQVIS
jgi:hypothetical protein